MSATRLIVHIDEEKCDGCGQCVPSCAEGAIQVIDGKARLLDDRYCDGLGACLGECPQGAITLEERPAAEFDEELVQAHLARQSAAHPASWPKPKPAAPACPSQAFRQWLSEKSPAKRAERPPSQLEHWPVKLALLNPQAPFLQNASLYVVADCVPVAYGNFHAEFLPDHAVAIACPKLDHLEAHVERLIAIFREAQPASVSVVHMEVPCCTALQRAVEYALAQAGSDLACGEVVIGIRGDRKAAP
jgi:Pyruvate/2-oxoacid:ferredoxin oxidoreductase delta subunit